MEEQGIQRNFKRNVAYKFRIGDILEGKQIFDGERLRYIEINGKEIFRVNVIANIVEKFVSEGERKYATLTLDDATGQIRLKFFGEEVDNVLDFNQGDTIMVIGLVRYWGNEIYLVPEIMKRKEPEFLLIRKLEVEFENSKNIDKEKIAELKEKILQMIKSAEEREGLETEKLILELREPPEIINREIRKLLEEGVAYEPRPGKLRYLG